MVGQEITGDQCGYSGPFGNMGICPSFQGIFQMLLWLASEMRAAPFQHVAPSLESGTKLSTWPQQPAQQDPEEE